MRRKGGCLLSVLVLGSVLGVVSSASAAETTRVAVATIRWVSPLEIERAMELTPATKAVLGTRVARLSSEGFIKVDRMPVAKTEILPEYPKLAKEQGLEARVVLQVFVDNIGTVRRARIIEESGHPYNIGFEKSALQAAIEGTFEPALRDGKPIGIWITFPVTFKLK